MSYTRTNWREGETPLSAQNMNNIEDGIEEVKAQKVDKVSGKALSDNNYTTAEKTKLAGIEAGAEVNQNAFGVVDIESGSATAIYATSKQDGITFKAGSNVSLLASGKNVTISATDTKYNAATTSAAGLMSAADKTKLNSIKFKMIKLYATADVTVAAGSTAQISYKVDAVTAGKYLYAIPGWFSYPSGVALTGFQASYTSSLKLDSINVWVTSLRNTVTIGLQSYPIGAFFVGADVS